MTHVQFMPNMSKYRPETKLVMQFKVIVLGDYGAGKSCLIERYVNNAFVPVKGPTISMEYYVKKLECDSQSLELRIWDTPGRMRALEAFPSFFRDTDVIILVYDVNHPMAFEESEKWLHIAKIHSPKDAIFYIVAAKCELFDGTIFPQDVRDFAEEHNFLLYDVSARENVGIEQLFNNIITRLLAMYPNKVKAKETIRLRQPGENAESKRCCDS